MGRETVAANQGNFILVRSRAQKQFQIVIILDRSSTGAVAIEQLPREQKKQTRSADRVLRR
jgi:hypothetical protein